jgi:fluoroquinolone resistance protein
MERIYVEDKRFEKVDFAVKPLSIADYENCSFINCNFSNVDLTSICFSECEFVDCNLSTAKLIKTSFRDAKFKDCKLMGLHFDHTSNFLFSVYFQNSVLDLSSFYEVNLKKTVFKKCILREVDFTGADLTNACFDNCDLHGAVFAHSILEKTDFRTAYNYSIDPASNRIKKAKFSLAGVAGLLDKFDIEID